MKVLVTLSLLLAVAASSVLAVEKAPSYANVGGFRDCLSSFFNGTVDVLCLPKERINTAVCNQETFNRLKDTNEFAECPQPKIPGEEPHPSGDDAKPFTKIEGFEDCVFENQVDTAVLLCLPAIKPSPCADEAFEALKKEPTLPACPPPPTH